MTLLLERDYFPEGTNGTLKIDGKLICFTIELPWIDNEKRVSCVPEGEYFLKRRFSQRYGWHLLLQNVPNRELILIHPANDAKTELQGCIAPVSRCTGVGTGNASRKAMVAITRLVFPKLAKDDEVKIIITHKKIDHEYYRKGECAHTQII